MIDPDRMKFQTPDFTSKALLKLAELFPGVVAEGKVNVDLLRSYVGEEIFTDEAYEFTWVGKRAAIAEAGQPIRKTLRPVLEDEIIPTGSDSSGKPYCSSGSKDWNSTENLYIEGDNLDVLKLLQESYLGKVKMVYIDPPYNTGNDFIYRDDFKQSRVEYDDETGEFEEDGNRLFRNTETNGRFHSDWCSMIFPRLVLARNLLRDDGVIFISIDDNESANLRKLCDEVFGETNFINELRWINNLKGRQISNFGAAKTNETILVYSKNSSCIEEFVIDVVIAANLMPDAYKNVVYETQIDEYGKFVVKNELYNTNSAFNEETRRNLVFDIVYNPTTGAIVPIDLGAEVPSGYAVIHPHSNADGVHQYHAWRWSREKIINEPHNLQILQKSNEEYAIFTKVRDFDKITLKDLITNISNGQNEVDKLLGRRIFDYPKSVALIQLLISAIQTEDSIVLDFFSGSATTAHAVMQQNAKDGSKRKFIMVQLPEMCAEGTEAAKAGYANICEIGKERIRRAGENIKSEAGLTAQGLDIGFRVLKLADTNMNEVYFAAGDYTQDMIMRLASNIKSDRTDMDLFFGCLLEWGLPLSMQHFHEEIDGFIVHTYNGGDLIACFEERISEKAVREIASREPLRAVFRDSSFTGSPEKINVFEIFKLLAPNTSVKVI